MPSILGISRAGDELRYDKRSRVPAYVGMMERQGLEAIAT